MPQYFAHWASHSRNHFPRLLKAGTRFWNGFISCFKCSNKGTINYFYPRHCPSYPLPFQVRSNNFSFLFGIVTLPHTSFIYSTVKLPLPKRDNWSISRLAFYIRLMENRYIFLWAWTSIKASEREDSFTPHSSGLIESNWAWQACTGRNTVGGKYPSVGKFNFTQCHRPDYVGTGHDGWILPWWSACSRNG